MTLLQPCWRSLLTVLTLQPISAAGETIAQLAERTGIPFGQVKFLCGGHVEKSTASAR
jgi:hypothetical protein